MGLLEVVVVVVGELMLWLILMVDDEDLDLEEDWQSTTMVVSGFLWMLLLLVMDFVLMLALEDTFLSPLVAASTRCRGRFLDSLLLLLLNELLLLLLPELAVVPLLLLDNCRMVQSDNGALLVRCK